MSNGGRREEKSEKEEILERIKRRQDLRKTLPPIQARVLRLISTYKRRARK